MQHYRLKRISNYVVSIVSLSILLLGSATSPLGGQNSTQIHGITIKGIIVNLGEIKEFVHNDTYLQIVQVSSTGETTLAIDEKSGITFKSQLAKIPFPSDGVFEFRKISLEEGKYVIAAQPLKVKTIPLSRINQPPLNTSLISSGKGKEGWPIAITIKKDANPEQLLFDLKKVWLPPPL